MIEMHELIKDYYHYALMKTVEEAGSPKLFT